MSSAHLPGPRLENYFNYFTEVEEHFCRRRGTISRLSPLDWTLIETWKDAGIPLEAVLRGIDTTFEHYERRPKKTKKINGLAWCVQEVLSAAEAMKEAAIGGLDPGERSSSAGLSPAEVAQFFRCNAEKLQQASVPQEIRTVALECIATLNELADSLANSSLQLRLEDLERRMTVLEEKLMAALTITTREEQLISLRADADREIAPYRSKMPAAQIEQLMKQFVHKRLLEQAKMPRLSLFYM